MADASVPGLGTNTGYNYRSSPMSDYLQSIPVPKPKIGACSIAENGTYGRVYTQTMSSYDPESAKRQQEAAKKIQACAAGSLPCLIATSDLQIKSVKATGELGPVEGTFEADKDGAKLDGKINYDPSKSKKKVELKADLKGEVCIEHKNGTKNGKGSWYTLEGQAKGVHFKLGVPDGEFCVGNNDAAYPGFKGSIEVGTGD